MLAFYNCLEIIVDVHLDEIGKIAIMYIFAKSSVLHRSVRQTERRLILKKTRPFIMITNIKCVLKMSLKVDNKVQYNNKHISLISSILLHIECLFLSFFLSFSTSFSNCRFLSNEQHANRKALNTFKNWDHCIDVYSWDFYLVLLFTRHWFWHPGTGAQ